MELNPNKQIEIINDTHATENTQKFLAGQKEHGGNFFAKPTVHNIREEAVDLINYTHVLIAHRSALLVKIAELKQLVLSHKVAVLVQEIETLARNL